MIETALKKGLHPRAEIGHPEEVTAYAPPSNMGPVPQHFRRRFDELRSESLAMQAEVTRLRDELGRRLAALPRPRGKHAGSGPSRYIDVSA